MKKDIPDSVTVVGIAQNAKEGAVIETSERIYYLQGIHSWNKSAEGKKVEVTGDLIKETVGAEDLKDKRGKWNQRSVGDKYIISHPVWKVIE